MLAARPPAPLPGPAVPVQTRGAGPDRPSSGDLCKRQAAVPLVRSCKTRSQGLLPPPPVPGHAPSSGMPGRAAEAGSGAREYFTVELVRRASPQAAGAQPLHLGNSRRRPPCPVNSGRPSEPFTATWLAAARREDDSG